MLKADVFMIIQFKQFHDSLKNVVILAPGCDLL